MSAETSKWLNTMTLIGNVLKRGKAWHWRAEDQGDEPNSYDGFIPVEDVRRRLFNFEAVSRPVFSQTEDGQFRQISNTQAIVHGNDGNVFGVVSDRYQIHQYGEVLLDNLNQIIDSSELGIDSAGLLTKSARGWVQISVPDSVTSSAGFEFRPTLLATTSHDGKNQTIIKRVMQAVVCDNTLAMALGEQGQQIKFRHSGNSMGDLTSVRNALDIVFKTSDDMLEALEKLSAWAVTDNQFTALVTDLFPINLAEIITTDEAGKMITVKTSTPDTRSAGKQNPKRDLLEGLWRDDARVTPWKNTALGVVQATTTFHQHFSGGDKNRYNRNYSRLLSNQQADYDKMVLERLTEVCA